MQLSTTALVCNYTRTVNKCEQAYEIGFIVHQFIRWLFGSAISEFCNSCPLNLHHCRLASVAIHRVNANEFDIKEAFFGTKLFATPGV